MSELPVWEKVPEYHYSESDQSRMILEVTAGIELGTRKAIFDLVDQFWVSTATWGLSMWEELVGLPTDLTLSYEARRGAIFTQMAGAGTCTSEMIEQIITRLTGYEAEIVEHPADYTVSLRFLGEAAGFVWVDNDAVKAAVEVVKPAHLKFVIEGITWKDFHAAQMTWKMLHDLSMTWATLEAAAVVHPKTEA